MGIEQARIYDIEPPAAAAAARRLTSEFQIDALVCSSACEAVRGASIIVTATQADEPLVMDEWVAPGATVISIGSWQEFDEEFVLNAKLVVDIYEHCIHRGELARLIQSGRITRHSIHALLGEVISGRKPGRQDPHERILVVPMGMGTHDVALAKTAFDNAMARGAGTSFRFF
jgi:ornithine cyclodeaminase/alanine dehydrogenase-like protein (mu-crystallin family)